LAQLVAGLNAMPAEELGGGEWLFAGKLDGQKRDRALAARDNQAVSGGLDHLARASVSIDDHRLVDDQANGLPRRR
jgi:hypothetical protein